MLTNHNKDLCRNFIDLAFTQKKPTQAAKLYLSASYIQHNPHAQDGRDAFSTRFERYFQEHPDTEVLVKRIVAEGNLVMMHIHSKSGPDDRGEAVVEIFRVENGKIAEHWDVVQSVPAQSANQNSMF